MFPLKTWWIFPVRKLLVITRSGTSLVTASDSSWIRICRSQRLVGATFPSWDDDMTPIYIWKVIIHSCSSQHQPVYSFYIHVSIVFYCRFLRDVVALCQRCRDLHRVSCMKLTYLYIIDSIGSWNEITKLLTPLVIPIL